MTAAKIYGAANVRRWHANPHMAHLPQTNGDHQGRAVQLLFLFHPSPSIALVRAVALHDVGERWAGDLSADFKRDNPEIAAAHAEIEARYRADALGVDILAGLDPEDLRWLKLVDRLEAYAYMVTHAPQEALVHGWPEDRRRIMAQIWALDAAGPLEQRVRQFLADLDRRAF